MQVQIWSINEPSVKLFNNFVLVGYVGHTK